MPEIKRTYKGGAALMRIKTLKMQIVVILPALAIFMFWST